jgi:type IV secretory pathway VirB9-like protein
MITAPSHFFQTWLAETKSTAFIYIKQEASAKDEQKARRGLAVLRRAASRTNQDDGKVKYGRPVRRL